MTTLSTSRATSNTAAEHVSDHNTIHTLNNTIDATWSTWTPTLTNLTQGNGTIISKYLVVGKTVHFRFHFTLGSTSSVGAAAVYFSLPVSATAEGAAAAVFNDAGTSNRSAGGRITATTCQLVHSTGWVSTTAPFTWASGDEILVTGTYETA